MFGDGEYLRTLVGFVLGVAGAYGVQWDRDRRNDRRVRRGMREAIAEDVIHNLLVLDAYERTFSTGQHDPADHPVRWPTAALAFAGLEACLEPASSSLLTPGEQLKLPLVLNQLRDLRDAMDETHRELFQYPASRAALYGELLSAHIPIVGQNMLDLLCQVLAHQDCFASSRVDAMQRQVRVVLRAEPEATRVWRTSQLPRAKRAPTRRTLAWHNDAPDKVPKEVSIVELQPDNRPYHTLQCPAPSWVGRLIAIARRPWWKRLLGWR